MKYLLFLIPLLYQTAALAQDTPQRCFRAYEAPVGGNEISVFCVGQQVYFRDCAGIDADKEYYDYDSSNGLDFNTTEARAKTFTFTRPGTYTVTQFGNLNGENATFERQFEVKAIAAPAFTAEVCAGRQVNVTVTDQTYSSYRLHFGDGTAAVEVTSGQQIPYTYATDGSYTLTLTGRHNQASCETTPATKTITTRPDLFAPRINGLSVLTKSETDGIINLFLYPSLNTDFFSYYLEEVTSSGVISSKPLVISNQPGLVIEKNLNTTKPTCYRIRATDPCGNEAVSTTVCSVILVAEAAESGNILLNWNTLTGVPGSHQMTHELLLLDQQDNIIQTIQVTGNSFSHIPDDVAEPILRYQLKAAAADVKLYSYSNVAEIPQPLRLYVPSAFTPNDDGLNDTFAVKGKFYQDFNIKIYNNLGQVVYTSADAIAGWDGTYRGKPLPQAAYVYEINVKAADGTSRTRTGTVTLIR